MNDFQKIVFDNIQRIQFEKFEKDFLFIVNGEFYETNSFIANFLSPNISRKYEENMKLSYYEINTDYEGDFNKIIEYGEMKKNNINEEEKPYFINVMKLLGNNYEFQQFYNELKEVISYENVIQRIQIKTALEINLDEEISFIATNFHDFHTKYPKAIYTLDVNIIEEILTNDKLKLYDEKELFDIVLKLYIKSKEYSTLFSYVIFMNLPTKSIREFNQNFDINDINNSIWEKVRCRLEQDISTEYKLTYKNVNQEFLNNRYIVKRYDNIIKHLSEQCQGNIYTKNIVNITSSSNNENYSIENIVEQNDNLFATENESNSWIQFDFKGTKVLLDRYNLKTFYGITNSGHMKSWVLQVSNDGENYKEIDRHENCELLNGPLKAATFQVSYSTPQRFIRLKQIGPNWNGNNQLIMNQIEFSGILY